MLGNVAGVNPKMGPSRAASSGSNMITRKLTKRKDSSKKDT
jgi:hypothetical protein